MWCIPVLCCRPLGCQMAVAVEVCPCCAALWRAECAPALYELNELYEPKELVPCDRLPNAVKPRSSSPCRSPGRALKDLTHSAESAS